VSGEGGEDRVLGRGKAILAGGRVVEGRESSDGFIPEVCLKAALPTA
jgi:hypothetical protein